MVSVEAPDTLKSPDTSNLVTVETPDTLKVPFTSNLAVGTLDPIPTLSVLPSEKIRLLSFNPSTRKSQLLPPSLITSVSIESSLTESIPLPPANNRIWSSVNSI